MLDPNQVKSADPVTYDDEGKVIPPSQRFDVTKRDTRYSLSLDKEQEQHDREVDALFEEAEERYRKKAEDKLEEALRGYGMKDAEIKRHLSIYQKGEEINLREKKEEKERLQKTQAYVYPVKEIAKGLEDILVYAINPSIEGTARYRKKSKKELVALLVDKLNAAEYESEVVSIARMMAQEVMAQVVYEDFDQMREREQLLAYGVREDFDAVRSYLGKISAGDETLYFFL